MEVPVFGKVLRHLRNQRGLSQAELADRSGLALRTLGYWEAGRRSPRNQELNLVLTALDATPDERTQVVTLLTAPRSVQLGRADAFLADENLQRDLGPVPELGDLLRAMRIRQGWTQEQLACALGTKRFMVLRWETSQHFPSEEHLAHLCDLLDAYPEERQALEMRRLRPTADETGEALEECIAETAVFAHQANRFTNPLIDLSALALKRRLRLIAGHSPEALRLLAEVEIEHGGWLMNHDRIGEAHAAVWRALNLMRARFQPDRSMVNALNLASSLISVQRANRPDKNRSAFRLLKEWLPLLPENYLRAHILADMALCHSLDGNLIEAGVLLKEARGFAYSPQTDAGEVYLRTTAARIRMRTQGATEDLDWMLTMSDTSNQRLTYLLIGTESLREAGEKRAALHYLTLAHEVRCEYMTPRAQRKLSDLTIALAS